MHITLQQTYYWHQMAADVTCNIHDCVLCAKSRVGVHRQAILLKLLPALEPLESVTIGIDGLLSKSQRDLQYIIVIVDRFTKLAHVVPLKRMSSISVAQTFFGTLELELWTGKDTTLR